MFDRFQKSLTVRCNLLFIAALGLTVTLAACGGEPTIDPLEIGDPVRGQDIFETGGGVLSGNCVGCHSLDGTVREGPSLQDISERAGERVPDLSAVEYIRQSIVDPSAYVVEGFLDNIMQKGFRFLLSEEDIDDLVAFLLTQ